MFNLRDIILEINKGRYNVGPFFHETDSKNVESILRDGIKGSGFPGKSVSLSPGSRFEKGMYGDSVFEVWFTREQFREGIIETMGWIGEENYHPENSSEYEMFEKLKDSVFHGDKLRSLDYTELKKIEDMVLSDNDLIYGELVYPGDIPPHQIRLIDNA